MWICATKVLTHLILRQSLHREYPAEYNLTRNGFCPFPIEFCILLDNVTFISHQAPFVIESSVQICNSRVDVNLSSNVFGHYFGHSHSFVPPRCHSNPFIKDEGSDSEVNRHFYQTCNLVLWLSRSEQSQKWTFIINCHSYIFTVITWCIKNSTMKIIFITWHQSLVSRHHMICNSQRKKFQRRRTKVMPTDQNSGKMMKRAFSILQLRNSWWFVDPHRHKWKDDWSLSNEEDYK